MKFSDTELSKLAEWSVPKEWWIKFDLDEYIPTKQDKKQFIKACEAIEQHAEEKRAPQNIVGLGIEKSKIAKKQANHNKK